MTELLAEPVVGWRRARLVLDGSPYGPFQALTSPERFDVESVATCRRYDKHEVDPWVRLGLEGLVWEAEQTGDDALVQQAENVVNAFDRYERGYRIGGDDHRAPEVGCRCGFYAMSRREDVPGRVRAMRDWPQGDVLLEVEMFGRYVRHQHGNRAERQRVVAVYLPPVRQCGHDEEALYLGPNGWVFSVCPCGSTAWDRQWSKIVPDLFEQVGPPDLTERIGTEVRWGEPDDWPERPRRGPATIDPRFRSRAYARALKDVREAHHAWFRRRYAHHQEVDPDGGQARAYSRAQADVRDAHREEFDARYAERLAEYGLTP